MERDSFRKTYRLQPKILQTLFLRLIKRQHRLLWQKPRARLISQLKIRIKGSLLIKITIKMFHRKLPKRLYNLSRPRLRTILANTWSRITVENLANNTVELLHLREDWLFRNQIQLQLIQMAKKVL